MNLKYNRSRVINVAQNTPDTLDNAKERCDQYNEEGINNDHLSTDYEYLKSVYTIQNISQVQSVNNICRVTKDDHRQSKEHSREREEYSTKRKEHSKKGRGELYFAHNEADEGQHKQFLLALVTTILVIAQPLQG